MLRGWESVEPHLWPGRALLHVSPLFDVAPHPGQEGKLLSGRSFCSFLLDLLEGEAREKLSDTLKNWIVKRN
jgi:hypothetical protein